MYRGDQMSRENRTSHLMVMFPADMVEEIDQYREDNRIRSRNKTIRALVKKGLETPQE